MKKMIACSAAAAAFLTAWLPSAPAIAQGCPAGTTPSPAGPGGPVPCIPITDWSSPSSQPGGRWANRWGAFAIDDITGKVGVAAGETSKGKAKKAAIAHCEARGGTKCGVTFSYYNQCAVALLGQNPDGTWYNLYQSAATLEEASQIALGKCRDDGASACTVKFSECSYPEFLE